MMRFIRALSSSSLSGRFFATCLVGLVSVTKSSLAARRREGFYYACGPAGEAFTVSEGNARSMLVPRDASLSALSYSPRNSLVPESSPRTLASPSSVPLSQS